MNRSFETDEVNSNAAFVVDSKFALTTGELWLAGFVCFVSIVIAICIKLPSQSIHAEIYAEMGTNYFIAARHESLWDNLWKEDYHYLPWASRLVAVVGIKFLGILGGFATFGQWAAVAFIAGSGCIFMAAPFRQLIPHDLARFFLGLGYALVPNYENYSFINFSYFGLSYLLLPLLCFPLLDTSAPFLEKSSILRNSLIKAKYLLVGLGLTICIMGKPVFVVFALPYWVWTVAALYRRNVAQIVTFGLPSLAVLIQLKTLVFNQGQVVSETKNVAFYETIILSVHRALRILVNFSLFHQPNIASKVYLAPLFAVIACLLVLFTSCRFFKLYRFKIAPVYITLFYLLFSSLLLLSRSFPESVQSLEWFSVGHLNWNRREIFSNQAAQILVFATFSQLLCLKVWPGRALVVSAIAAPFFFLTSTRLFFKDLRDHYSFTGNSFSEWRSYAQLAKSESYAIPVNPKGWYAIHNAKILTIKVREEELSEAGGAELMRLPLSPSANIPADSVVGLFFERTSEKAANQTRLLIELSSGKTLTLKRISSAFSPLVYFSRDPEQGDDALSEEGQGAGAVVNDLGVSTGIVFPSVNGADRSFLGSIHIVVKSDGS